MAESRPGRRRYELQLWIDRRVGPLVCAILLGVKRLLRRRLPPPEPVRKILLVKFWGMGSIVLATPLLERLRARYPDARLDFVSLRENEPLLALLPGLGRIRSVDLSRGNLRFLAHSVRTLIDLRRERYDLLLDLEFFTRFSAIFSYLAGARRSHGFSAKGNWRGRLHDVEVPFNAYNHVATNFETLLHGDPMRPVGAGQTPLLPVLDAPEAAWRQCRALLEAHPAWRAGRPLVAVNPNAGEMAVERRWPLERMADLLARLCDERDVNVALIGAPSEREYVASVARVSGAGERAIDLAGRVDVAGLVALLAHADLLVTNDSGPMHIAAAAGTSTVALFGPETPSLYAPLRSRPDQRHRLHYVGLACSPCMFVHDNKVLSCWFAQARCMTGIEARDVLASVDALLAPQIRPARLRVIDS